MPRPRILSENLFNRRAFPGHVVTATEEAVGSEAFRVYDGRRATHWAGVTTNVVQRLTVMCDRPRLVDMLVLWGGHNLAGKQVKLQASDDGFSSTGTQTLLDVVLPAAATPGTLADVFGVRTENGDWLKEFGSGAAREFRLEVPAMGVGLIPQITGIWLGKSWAPTALRLPHAQNDGEPLMPETESEWGYLGRGSLTVRRGSVMRFKLTGFEEELARYHLEGHYRDGRPTWIVDDDTQAERAVLAVIPRGRLGVVRDLAWFPKQVDMPWIEHQPRRIA